MREEQIKILSELARKYSRYPHPEDLRYKNALTDAISFIRDTSEIEKAARYALATLRSFDEKYFFDDSDYHLLSETAIEKLESALDAYREVKEKR